jgi:aspartyl-tRNA(Asn)/glutamyl-tRNA(Gln) amidotransferase subunit A
MTDADLVFASIEQVAPLVRKRKISPVELTKLMLERIERLNPKLNAYLTVTAAHALEQARRAEKEIASPRGRARYRGPLHGIPISLKDNIETAGIRTTAGSKILRDFVPREDAPVVTRLRRAGAILLGKTNLHEFAYGVSTDNPHYGPARNPWNVERIPGGSSGGSAVAVAAGLCFASIGTDTGGSIRNPAALCGVVGLKPTWGAVSCVGVVPLSPALDHLGTLTRTVPDAAILLDAIWARGSHRLRRGFFDSLRPELRSFRLGRPREFFFDVLSDEVRSVFERAVRSVEKRGARIVDVSIPLLRETEEAGNLIAWAEATHYHQQAGFFPARAAEYGEDVRERLERGAAVPATSYLRALESRRKFQAQLADVLSEVDALVVPTNPIAAPLIGEESTRIGSEEHATRALLLRLNRPANLAGVPALTFPCGLTAQGLPVGMQLIVRSLAEDLLLRIAAHCMRDCGGSPGRPPEGV